MKSTKRYIFIIIFLSIFLFSEDSEFEEYNKNQFFQKSYSLFTIYGGYAFSDWKMPEMDYFNQETQGLNLFWIDLIYKGNRNKVEKYRNYLHYEHSFNDDWDKEKDIIPQKDVLRKGGGYELLKGKLTFPFFFQIKGKEKSFFLKASMERYLSQISAKEMVQFVTNNGKVKQLNKGDNLYFETKFNEVSLGINHNQYNIDETYTNYETFIFFGDYQKPYTVMRNGDELAKFNNYLFYSSIISYGLGLKIEFDINNFYFASSLKFGWADIKLTDNLKLVDIGFDKTYYSQFKIGLGYSFNPIDAIDNLKLNIRGIFDIRYFDEPQANGDIYVGTKLTNRDIIKKIYASIKYSF